MRQPGSNKRLSAALAAVLLTSLACGRQERVRLESATVEEPPGLASMVHVADPKTSAQLLRGFHGVEQDAWRWTTGKFSVALRPPANAPQKGAVLVLRYVAPDPLIDRIKKVSLSASIEGLDLPAETVQKSGEYTYRQEVPASSLMEDAVTVNFSLNEFLPAGTVDQRELGVIVTAVGFEAK